jgi:hypothetical protein
MRPFRFGRLLFVVVQECVSERHSNERDGEAVGHCEGCSVQGLICVSVK